MSPVAHAQPRIFYGLAFIAAIATGLASRRFATALPPFVADYAGDTIWAAMAFFGLSMLLPRWPLLRRTLATLAFCYLIETSQLYQAPWINRVRRTTIGALVLGRGILWSDLACYTAGVAGAVMSEVAVRLGCHRPRHSETCEMANTGLEISRPVPPLANEANTIPTETCRRS